MWRLTLNPNLPGDALNTFYRLLSTDEARRADGIRVAPVRNEFIAGRGLLKRLLGAAIGVDAKAIQLAAKSNGKPYLLQSQRVEFNVSHSEGMILIALSRASTVGIDVEFVSDEFGEAEELMGIARESFHADEFTLIARKPPGRDRLLAFYRAWTRREAVAKADGRGIASVLRYEVFEPDEFGECQVRLAGSPDFADESGDVDYFVQTPEAGPHHVTAVATRKPRQALATFDARLLQS